MSYFSLKFYDVRTGQAKRNLTHLKHTKEVKRNKEKFSPKNG